MDRERLGRWMRPAAVLIAAAAAASLPVSVGARAGAIALACLILWLTDWVPLWMPTIALWVLAAIFLSDGGAGFQPAPLLSLFADPVLVLFLAGFTIAAAAHHSELDGWIVGRAVQFSDGDPSRLVVIVSLATIALAMWISNVAAAALVFGAMQPVLKSETTSPRVRAALLLAVALCADFAGIATPVGSGPNGIAMAAVERVHRIDFLEWMAFGVPLTALLVAAALAFVLARLRGAERIALVRGHPTRISRDAGILCGVVAIAILLWMTEGVHGIPAWQVALGTILVILAARLIGPREIRDIDWTTLLLIAGGIGLGRLLDRAGTVRTFAQWLPLDGAPHFVALFALCLVSAWLSALMSNTATASLLIPLSVTIDPSPSTAVLIAVSASLGVPFVISTPPNAIAVANGLRSRELLVPGLLILVAGCAVVALTGPWVLHAVGIP